MCVLISLLFVIVIRLYVFFSCFRVLIMWLMKELCVLWEIKWRIIFELVVFWKSVLLFIRFWCRVMVFVRLLLCVIERLLDVRFVKSGWMFCCMVVLVVEYLMCLMDNWFDKLLIMFCDVKWLFINFNLCLVWKCLLLKLIIFVVFCFWCWRVCNFNVIRVDVLFLLKMLNILYFFFNLFFFGLREKFFGVVCIFVSFLRL